MCCCDNSCKCCACTIVADSAIWAAIFIHLNAIVALGNLHMIPFILSVIEATCFWVMICNRRKVWSRRTFYYVYLIGTVGSLIGYIWYSIHLATEKEKACKQFAVRGDPTKTVAGKETERRLCEQEHEMEDGYGYQFVTNFILICLSCCMYPFLVAARDLKGGSGLEPHRQSGGGGIGGAITQIVNVNVNATAPAP